MCLAHDRSDNQIQPTHKQMKQIATFYENPTFLDVVAAKKKRQISITKWQSD